jgi:hypothetical protein
MIVVYFRSEMFCGFISEINCAHTPVTVLSKIGLKGFEENIMEI